MSECRAHAVIGDTRPRGDGEPRELEDALGALPPRKVHELVRAEDEDRVLERARLERVDGARVRVELDLRAEHVREREPRELESCVRGRRHVLVAGVGDDEYEEPLEVELLDARRARAPRARCAAGRRRRREARSLPLERLAVDLDLRPALDPDAAQRLLELLRGGGVPVTR